MQETPIQVLKAMQFVQNRFNKWGFTRNIPIYADKNGHCQIIAFNAKNESALAVFTAFNKSFESTMEFQDDVYTSKKELMYNYEEKDEKDDVKTTIKPNVNSNFKKVDHRKLIYSTNSDNSGTVFIKSVVDHVRKNKIKRAVIVSDDITVHGKKGLNMSNKSISFHLFTYDDVYFDQLTENNYQPISSRKLTPDEKKDYIEKNPNYRTEIQKLSKNDNYVKWSGFVLDDIILLTYTNNKEYALVIENLELKSKDKKKGQKYDA